MLTNSDNKAVLRIIDANVNRAKEGLRVCEELARFLLNDKNLSSKLKAARHKISAHASGLACYKSLSLSRDSYKDVGRKVHIGELSRSGLKDILFANIQRAKESTRVLEEFSKLFNKRVALGFKQTRYNIYEIEKKLAKKIADIRDSK